MEKIALFSVKITGKLVKKGLIQEEDALLYSYGIENGIWLAASIFTAVVIGIMTGRLGVVMVFLLFYSMLRSYRAGCIAEAGLCVMPVLQLYYLSLCILTGCLCI